MPDYKDDVPIEFKPDNVMFSLSIIADFLGKDWLDRVENRYRTHYTLEASLEENLHPISPWISAYRKHLNNRDHPISNNLIKLERLADCIKSFKNQSGFDKFAEKLKDKKTFLPTVFELEAATICQRKGFEVEFIPEKNDGRTPEFFVSNKKGQRYEVECKSLDQKTVGAQKEDSILANAFKYAKTNQKKRQKFYTFAILAEEKIAFHDYKNIFDSTLKSKTHMIPGNINTTTREITYEKLGNKRIYYAAKYNGASGEELPSDYCNGLLNLPLHNHIVEFKGRQGDKKCQDVFSIHTTTPYTRDIVKSIVTRFETARKQISSENSGFIFIKIPEAHFSEKNVSIVEDSVKEIKKKFAPGQNTRIALVAIMSSAFEIGEDNDLTFMKCVFIHNPHAQPAADEFMK